MVLLGSESSELVRVEGLRVTLNHLRGFIDLGLIKGISPKVGSSLKQDWGVRVADPIGDGQAGRRGSESEPDSLPTSARYP